MRRRAHGFCAHALVLGNQLGFLQGFLGDLRVLAPCQVKGVGDGLYMVRAPNRQPSAATLALMDMLVTSIRAMAPHWDFAASDLLV